MYKSTLPTSTGGLPQSREQAGGAGGVQYPHVSGHVRSLDVPFLLWKSSLISRTLTVRVAAMTRNTFPYVLFLGTLTFFCPFLRLFLCRTSSGG